MIAKMFSTLIATFICTFIISSVLDSNCKPKIKSIVNVLYCAQVSLMTALAVAAIWGLE